MRGVLSADANLPASSVGRLAFANGAVRGLAACLVWMLIVQLRKEKPNLDWQEDGIEALIRSLFEISKSWHWNRGGNYCCTNGTTKSRLRDSASKFFSVGADHCAGHTWRLAWAAGKHKEEGPLGCPRQVHKAARMPNRGDGLG